MPEKSPDFYKILQVDSGAESDVIDAAYRKLAQKYHPDKSHRPDATRYMQQLNEAYAVLRDSKKRVQYDAITGRNSHYRPQPSTEKPAPSTISVMIVDQIDKTQDNIKKLLQFEPRINIVGMARTGREAIIQFRKLQPDLVIMGIHMPDMDGIEATRIICREKPDARIIILTVESGPEYIRLAFKAGARDYLLKPPLPHDLIASIIKHGNKHN